MSKKTKLTEDISVREKNKVRTKALAMIFTAMFVLSCVPTTAWAASSTASSLQQKVDEAKNTYEAESNQLKDAQQDTQEAKSLVSSLNAQSQKVVSEISSLNTQIDDLSTQIADLQQQIADKEAEITVKQGEFDSHKADFKARMAAMQELHDGGTISMLTAVQNIYQLLTFADVLQDITVKDNEILTSLENERTALETEKADLDANEASLETNKQTLEGKQAELEDKKSELAASIGEANSDLTAAKAAEQAQEVITEESKKKWDKALAEQDAYIKSQLQTVKTAQLSCGMSFRSPLDSYSYISTHFGDVDDWHSKAHAGVDFAAKGGTPIHAVENGYVIIAKNSSSYGNYVVISHGTGTDGNSYATLYAHQTSYCVSVGQYVNKGDVIGYVGSTGRSTGNHLHLELWKNGTKINPLLYIPA